MQDLIEGLAGRVGELQDELQRQIRQNKHDEGEDEDEEEEKEEERRPPPRGGCRLTDAQLYRDILKLYKEVAPSDCKSSNNFEIYNDDRRANAMILKIIFCKIDDLSSVDKSVCVDFVSLKKVLLEKYFKLRDIHVSVC